MLSVCKDIKVSLRAQAKEKAGFVGESIRGTRN
jgi:hypothetical protein